jgi:coproporphyrinogen III oxidase
MVPTVHANWRYFEMYDDNGNVIQQWFGGQDLTPIIYLKKMRFIFIKRKTLGYKHNLEFYPNIKTM